MNASLYGEIGKTIASIGSRHFARMFRDLVNSHLTAEASELQLCTCSQEQPLPLAGQTVAEAQERDPARTLQPARPGPVSTMRHAQHDARSCKA